MTVDHRSKIETRAYRIWESEGRRDGAALEHWLRAERELATEQPATAEVPAAPAPRRPESQRRRRKARGATATQQPEYR